LKPQWNVVWYYLCCLQEVNRSVRFVMLLGYMHLTQCNFLWLSTIYSGAITTLAQMCWHLVLCRDDTWHLNLSFDMNTIIFSWNVHIGVSLRLSNFLMHHHDIYNVKWLLHIVLCLCKLLLKSFFLKSHWGSF